MRGVLDALGRDGAGDLLKAHGEEAPLRPLLGIGRRGVSQEQRVADEVEDGDVDGGVAPLGLGHRVLDVGPVAGARLPAVLAHVGAVDGKGGDDLAQRARQARQREVAEEAVSLGDAVQVMAELVDLARHRDLHDEALGGIGLIGHARVRSREAPVDRRHAPRGAAIDEEPVDRAQEVVARRARHDPPLGQGLAGHEDLLGGDPERPRRRRRRVRRDLGAVVRGERLEVARAEVRHEAAGRRQHRALLEPPEVFDGRVEPVGVVDAQAGDLALAHEAQDELMRGVEDLRHLHPQRGEVVHVEEAAVVDLVARHAPVGEPVRLGGQEPVEEVEARGISFRPVQDPEIFLDVLADLRRLLDEGGEAPLDDLLLAQALRNPRGIRLRPAGQVLERGEDAPQLAQPGVLGAEPLREARRGDARGSADTCPGSAGRRAPAWRTKNAPSDSSTPSCRASSTRPYWSGRTGSSTVSASSRFTGCQSMSKNEARGELGPFSSTSSHHGLESPAMPM